MKILSYTIGTLPGLSYRANHLDMNGKVAEIEKPKLRKERGYFILSAK